MSNTRRKVAALMPLVERMHRGHCWIKMPDGPRHIDEAFTEFMLAEHVAGRKAYGLTFVAPGESTCKAACFDLDSHKGETPFEEMMVVADELIATARLFGLEGVPFRSSGGHGVHIWFMWAEAQDAHSVRETLREILEACGLRSGTEGVRAGAVEIFPKQSSVPLDGFGSMIILPLAGESTLLGD
jgi:hypothetical protein